MKHSILILGISLFATLLFTRCDTTETIIDFNQDIDVTIQGIVYDNNGNTPLSGVKVSLGEDTVSTGSDGFYYFKGNVSGSYLLKFEKASYATMVQELSASGTDFSANAIVSSSPIFMFEQDQTLSTKLQVSNGVETTPATDIDVTVTIDGFSNDIFFENNTFETTTDSEGNISLSGLPNQQISIVVDFTEGDESFTLNQSLFPSSAAVCYTLAESSLSKFDLVDTNLVDENGDIINDFNSSDNITFTFSDEIDAEYENMSVTLDKSGLDVLISSSISGNTITIDPMGDDLEEDASYTIDLSVRSTSMITYFTNITFTVLGEGFSLDQVTDLALDDLSHDSDLGTEIQATATSVTIEFEEVEGANTYEVYGRYSEGTDEYVLLNSFDSPDGDNDHEERLVFLNQTGIDIPEDGFFDDGSFFLIVRAVSGNVYGEFSNALEIEEGDDN